MGVLADILNIITSEYGWIVVLVAFFYQLYWPFWETRGRQIVNRIEDKIDAVDDKQLALTQVVRALARVNADQHKEMDPEQVDNHLVENGIEPDEFIIEQSGKQGHTYTAQDDDSQDQDDKKGFH